MTKAELIQKLIEQGRSTDELKGLKVAELENLLQPEAESGPLLQIISKRKDGSNCYWLEDGTKLPWSECRKYFPKANSLAPLHKAKDYAQETTEGWVLKYRNEVEK